MMMKRASFLLSLFALIWLGGCSHSQNNANIPSRDSLQGGEQVIVAPNENVYVIAKKRGVAMRDIIALNDLKPPYTLKVGQTLTLPYRDGVYGDLPKPPDAAPRTSIEAVPLEPINGNSVTSEPLSPISSTSSSSSAYSSNAKSATPSKSVDTTVKGRGASMVTSESLMPTNVAPAPVAATSSSSAVSPSSAPSPSATAVEPQAKTATPSGDTAPAGNFSAIPPLQGPVISPFGSGNDGINIGAPKGSSVVSAAGGMVVYAGNEMKGFGNLILIRHEGGWVTAYAHLDRMLVTKDSIVAAGDQIGTVGTTGGVSVPQLHFETRYESKPMDPKPYLKP